MSDKLSMSLEDIIAKNKKPKPQPKTHQKFKNQPFKRNQGQQQSFKPKYSHPQPSTNKPRNAKPAQNPTPKNHLYLSSLDPSVTCDDLREVFGTLGEMTLCKIHWDNLGRSKG